MGNTSLWIALVALALGALMLYLGFRGTRIDREPRCPARKCKYALGSVISAKREHNQEPYPLTCPECGRTIATYRALRIGTRKKIKTVVALGVAMLLVGLGAVGFEGYAVWRSTKAINTMPMWLLLRNAERDTDANRFAHQQELMARVLGNKFDPDDAPAIIERILKWQADPNVGYRWAGDALFDLALQGHVTEEQQNRAWANMWRFDLRPPESVEAGAPLPLTFLAHYRGGGLGAGLPLIWEHPWEQERARGFNMGNQTTVRVESLRINGESVPLPDNSRTLRALSHIAEEYGTGTLGWSTTRGPWNIVVAPDLPPDSRVDIEVDLAWDFTNSGMNGLKPDPEKAGHWITAGQWLARKGVPTKGSATVRASTRIAAKDTIAVTTVDRPEVNDWLHDKLARSVVRVVRQPQGYYSVHIHLGPGDMDNLPADPPTVFARAIIHHNGWGSPVGIFSEHAVYGSFGGRFGGDLTDDMMGMFLAENPTGWELELVPYPEQALLTAERPPAWAGAPIRTPIAVEIDIRCWGNPAAPMLFVPEGNPLPRWAAP